MVVAAGKAQLQLGHSGWFCPHMGAQAGLNTLYTCTSWYAYAAMFGSSMRSLI